MTDLSEIVLAGMRGGKQQIEIAKETGKSRSCITRQVNKLRALGRLNDKATGAALESVTVKLPPKLMDRLRHEATLRSMSTQNIATRLLATILTDDIVTAVLDDQPEERGANGVPFQ